MSTIYNYYIGVAPKDGKVQCENLQLSKQGAGITSGGLIGAFLRFRNPSSEEAEILEKMGTASGLICYGYEECFPHCVKLSSPSGWVNDSKMLAEWIKLEWGEPEKR